jgi:hypothetical protein
MVCRVAIGRQLVTDDRVTAERLHPLVLRDARGIPTQDSPASAAHLGGRRRPSAAISIIPLGRGSMESGPNQTVRRSGSAIAAHTAAKGWDRRRTNVMVA